MAYDEDGWMKESFLLHPYIHLFMRFIYVRIFVKHTSLMRSFWKTKLLLGYGSCSNHNGEWGNWKVQ